MESLPKKSKITLLGGSSVTCSYRNEQQPTVSASSSPFSLPARRASRSMKYNAVARCLSAVIFDFRSM